jgi:phthalate 4,5-dioxygenase
MTTEAENEFLTGIGPGTPTGALLRQYRIPDPSVGEACCRRRPAVAGATRREAARVPRPRPQDRRLRSSLPRCASPFFGRIEKGRLRRAYHGGKFDTEGNYLDMPDVPGDHDLAQRFKARLRPGRAQQADLKCAD